MFINANFSNNLLKYIKQEEIKEKCKVSSVFEKNTKRKRFQKL